MSPERSRLVASHWPLVKLTVALMQHSIPPQIDLGDAISAGVDGLLRAIDTFDPTRGRTFRSYTIYCVRKAILEYLRNRSIERRRFECFSLQEELEQTTVDVEALALLEVFSALLRREVSRLPPRERVVIHQRYWLQETFVVIRRQLGVSETRVYQLHDQALARLRVKIEGQI